MALYLDVQKVGKVHLKYKLYGKKCLIEELLKAKIPKRQIAIICKADRNTLDRYIKQFIEA